MRKTVLVTGGSCGLGSSLAWEFAKGNYDIILTYFKNEDNALSVRNKIKESFEVDVKVVKIDLEKEEEISRLVESIEKIDVLINNAAYNNDGDILEKGADNFLKTYKVNAVAPFLLSKGLYEKLKSSRGTIINVCSTNGIDTVEPSSADYDASKAALLNLTKNLALAFAPLVRVNAVAPGWLDTASTSDMEPKYRRNEENKILLGRFAKVEEVAKVIYFLCSEEASYINGEVIRIDGGIHYGN